ncbi:helix-turn-helix transcriptional regulator [Nonomuraea mesophila]|uniref:Helix-turn-helix transcriptional regulator n=1 Tax=Nonomuraea mesophila TaxID=2530382 RepID=A0A4R5FDW5_9ACTN|nr:LuxR family transcriptional regulator [Nonomuraea mesophila]TDE47237.1 helix-turn-helix transcriptional regulator [Nonomuraea mesophila]
MGLFERDAAMTSMHGLLAEAVGGKGRVVMVTGVVATGKSELLHAFAEQALERGALPLVASATQAESDIPLGVLGQLFQNAPLREDVRAVAADLLREGAEMASPAKGDRVEQVDVQIVHSLCAVLLSLAERHPLAIVVDDVHLADRASLLCLSYLVRRSRYAPLVTVFSQAEYRRHMHGFFATEMLRQPHCTAVRLAPLSYDAALGMTAERLGEAVAKELAPEWHALSGGNPLLLRGLIEDHEAGGSAPAERYGEAVLSCLHRADPGLMQIAGWLAVLDDPALLERLLGSETASVSDAMHWLETAGLLESGRFRAEIARRTVLAELSDEVRRSVHRRAAELLHEEGADDVVIAEHLLGADATDLPWAVPVLETAALHRLDDGAVTAAVDLLKLAWRGCTDERRRTTIATVLMRAEWRINPSSPSEHLAELTDALHNGTLRGSDAVVLARALLWHGKVDDACQVLEHLKESGDTEPQTVAELIGTRLWLRCSAPPLLAHVNRSTSEQAREAVLPVRVSRRLESINALTSVLTRGPRERILGTVERILHSSRLDEMSMDTVESSLLALTYGGWPDKAAPWCDAFIEEAQSRSAPARRARLTAIRAEIAMRRGDLETAASCARQALELIPPASWGVTVGGPLANLMLASTAMGQYDKALAQVNTPVPDAMLQTRFGLHYLHARGRYHLAVDHPAAALRDFRFCGELMAEWEMDTPGFIAWRTDAAEALIRMGEQAEARALIEEQLSRCGPTASRTHGIALRLLAATSELRHRPMLLRQSTDRLQACGDRYELVRSLFDLTEAFHSVGEFRRAGIIASRTRILAQECGAQPLSQALDGDGAAAAEGQGSEISKVVAILSDAERRVAGLAAVGYTNREIAAKLFITVSTVEQHLTRIYRKLGITQRSDLPPNLELSPTMR